jgi:gliding motility-associated-like protein
MKLRITLVFFLFLNLLLTNKNFSQGFTCDTNAIKAALAANYDRLYVQGFPCAMYFIAKTDKSWLNSQQDAMAVGANLTSILSQAENDAIVQAANAQGLTGGAWIGYTDAAVEGNWIWVDGSQSTYTNWNQGEPNNSSGIPCYQDEDAALIQFSNGKWNDLAIQNICGGSLGKGLIKVNLCPVVNVNPSVSVCAGTTPTITAVGTFGSKKSPAPSYDYFWFIPPNTTPVDLDSTFNQPLTNSTTLIVGIRDRYQCSDTALVNVTVNTCAPPVGPKGCNITQIINTFTSQGYIQLNVQGQDCSLYFINPTSQDAAAAQAAAQALGANLVVMNDAQENQNVVNALNAQNAFSLASKIWIGYKRTGVAAPTFFALDSSTGPFLTPTTGGPTPGVYQNWAPNEPNNDGYQCSPICGIGCNTYACNNGEQCVQIYSNGLWNDEKCNDASSISVIEVNLCPQITGSNDTTICEGRTAQLRTRTILGSPSYSYLWSSGQTTPNIFVSPASTTQYIFRATDRYGCYSEDTVTVTVNNCPPITGPQGCNIQQIINTFTGAGYIPLPVQGEDCSLYFINPTSQDAAQAQSAAAALGANLVVFNDATENQNVVNALNANNVFGQYGGTIWIGYRRTGTAAPTFYTLDGSTGPFLPGPATSSLFQNWAPGEPNNNAYNSCFGGCNSPFCSDQYRCINGEQCVQIYSNGLWNDLPCNRTSVSIIEVNLCPKVNATFNNQTLFNLKKDTTVCAGATVTLRSNPILGSPPYTYQWTPSGKTTKDITEQILQTQQYVVRVTDRYSCYSFDTLVANVQGTFNAGFTASPSTVCAGRSTFLNFNGTPSPNATFSWGLDGGSIASGNPTGPGPLEVRWNTPGTKNLTLNITDGGCAIPPANGTVTVNPNPVADAGNDQTICSGGTTVLGGPPVANATYFWTPTIGLSDSLVANPTVRDTNFSNSPRVRKYYLITTVSGCSAIDSVLLTVNPPQNTSISPTGPIQVCKGGSVTLSTAQQFAQQFWNNNATTSSITVNQNGNYHFLAIDQQGCIWKSDTVQVNVSSNPLPTTISTTGTLPVCKGGSIVLRSDSTYAAYSWSNNANTKDITVTQAGTYYLTAVNADNCEVRSNDLVITFNPNPIPITIAADGPTSFCEGGSVNLSTVETYQSYFWNNNQSQPSINVNQSGTYRVTTTDLANCEGLSNDIVVTVFPLPEVNLVQLTDQKCFGTADGSITVEASNGSPTYTYEWSNGQTGTVITQLLPNTYSVTVTDLNQCTQTRSFTLLPAPTFDAQIDNVKDVTCFNGSDGSLSAVGIGGAPGYRYLWSNNAQTPIINRLTAGNYSVTVFDSKNCTATAQAIVEQPEEIVAIPPDSTVVKLGKNRQLNINVTPVGNNYTYDWRPQRGLSCYDCPNPVASPVKSMDYTLIVRDANGCADTLQIPITVLTDKTIFIPNFFSPNDDGNNEFWCVFADALQSIDLKVFNRWGELVFATTDLQQCWDGYYRGNRVDPGLYVYVVRFSFIDETWTQREGSVFVYR